MAAENQYEQRIEDRSKSLNPLVARDADISVHSAFSIADREPQCSQSGEFAMENPGFSGSQWVKTNNEQRDCFQQILAFWEKVKDSNPAITKRQIDDFKRRYRNLPADDLFAWYKLDNKRSAYFLKASLRAVLIYSGKSIIKSIARFEADPCVKFDDRQPIEKYLRSLKLANEAGVFDKNDRHTRGRWIQYWAGQEGRKLTRGRSDSTKRNTVNQLPEYWQELLAEKMAYDPAVDLLISTGLRAVEIKSVRLERSDDGFLIVIIQTAKSGKDQPQRTRTIIPNPMIPAVGRLLDKIDTIDFSGFEKDAFRLRLGRASKHAFGIRVSPKVFRHALAGAAKEAGIAEGTLLSQALGHTASRTTSGYGNVSGKSKSGRESPILGAKSSEPVRETRSNKYRSKGKQMEDSLRRKRHVDV
jgi:integrase